MAIALAGSLQWGGTPATTGTAITSGSFTPASGELLVAIIAGGGQTVVPSSVSSTGQSLTWTKRVATSAVASTSPVAIFTATTTSAAAMTVSAFFSPAGDTVGCTLLRFTGAQLAASPVTAQVTGDATAPYSTTITTTGTGSVVAWGGADYNGVNTTPTLASPATLDQWYVNPNQVTCVGAHQAAATAGTQTVSITAPTGCVYSLVAIEVQAIPTGSTFQGAVSMGAVAGATAGATVAPVTPTWQGAVGMSGAAGLADTSQAVYRGHLAVQLAAYGVLNRTPIYPGTQTWPSADTFPVDSPLAVARTFAAVAGLTASADVIPGPTDTRVGLGAFAALNLSEQPLIPGPNTIPGPSLIPGGQVAVTTYGGGLLSASTALGAGATYVGQPKAALAGSAALVSDAQTAQRITNLLTGIGGLTATLAGTYFFGRGAFEDLHGESVLTVPATALRTIMGVSVVLAPTTTLTARGLSKQFSRAQLAGTAGLAVLETAYGKYPINMLAVSRMPTAGQVQVEVAVALTDETQLAAASWMFSPAAAALVGDGELAPDGWQLAYAAGVLAGAGTLSADGWATALAVAALNGASTLGPQAWTFLAVGAALHGQSGGLITTLIAVWQGATVMLGDAELVLPAPVRFKEAIVALTGTARMIVDAVVHSIIPPTFRPQPLTPPRVVPKWHLYIADTRTGRIAYELPVITQQWTSKLNDMGTAQAEVNVEEAYDAISSWDERDPRVLFRQFLSGPMRYSGVFVYGNTAVWAGPLGGVQAAANEPTIQLGFTEFEYLLTRRLLLGDRTDPVSVAGDLNYGPTTKQQIALSIIKAVTTDLGASYQLPWQMPQSLPTSGPNDVVRNYHGYDFMTAWDALTTLSQEADGPDIRFDPVLTYTPDGMFLSYDLQLGNPLIYSSTTWAWDVPATAQIQWSSSVQNFGTRYWGTGSGQDRLKLAAESTNPSLTNLGFPEIELSDTLHSSVTDLNQLQSLVNGDMALYESPTMQWSLSVQGSRDPMVGSFRVGDNFNVTVQGHPAVPDGTFRRRITALSGDQSEWVTIKSSDAYIVMSTTMEGVQLIISA